MGPEARNAHRWHVIALVVAVLLLRLPFLNQPIQGDDYYYLSGAIHAQIDPLHPTHGQYVFAGEMVEMRGHPHPPLNMWFLGALLAIFGDIEEVRFHAAYILFSLMAVLAMWSLARRFSPSPLLASLLFLAVPAFVVNGNSLESDVPFLACWMASVALFVAAADRRSLPLLAGSLTMLIPAALAAYQSVLLIPIMAIYLWLRDRKWLAGWLVTATPALVLGLWQLFERITGGVLPAEVLAGHFVTYGLQQFANKLDNAVALTVHAGWMIFPPLAIAAFWRVPRWVWVPVLGGALAGGLYLDPHPLFWVTFGVGLLVALACLLKLRDWADQDQWFLTAWSALFFGAALILFFAGSARYLLPMAAPLCLLVTRQLSRRPSWLIAGIACQLALSFSLAMVSYDHWNGYRKLVAGLKEEIGSRRTWINAEWGLRYYAEKEGGVALEHSQPVQPGEMALTSEIAYPIEFTTGGGVRSPLEIAEITSPLPFRLIGLNARSAYSTVTLGYRPFDLVFGPIDRVRADIVVERQPELSYLPMSAPEAESQIVSGVYKLEDGAWRWMAQRGVVLLKRPAQPAPVEAVIYIPDMAPVRVVTLSVDGQVVARTEFPAPGSFTVRSDAPVAVSGEAATVEIRADASFFPTGDRRPLGLVLSAVGFRTDP